LGGSSSISLSGDEISSGCSETSTAAAGIASATLSLLAIVGGSRLLARYSVSDRPPNRR
jgi:hypothetical protein